MTITAVHLEFEARLATADHGLAFLGATLRGAFGHVLKATVCQVSHRDCSRCLLVEACPYPAIFDGRPPRDRQILRTVAALPQPFALEVAAPGTWLGEPTELRWGLRMFGAAARWSPYIVEAFIRAGVRGIGRRRVPYTLLRVTDGTTGTAIWSDGSADLRLPSEAALAARPLPASGAVRWRFHTPVHVRDRGTRLDALDGLYLVLAGRRRWRLLDAFYGDGRHAVPLTPLARLEREQFRTLASAQRPWGFTRFSGRQHARMDLGGTLGEVVIDGPWGEVGRWMQHVEQTHIGKHASFGFGRVTWESV